MTLKLITISSFLITISCNANFIQNGCDGDLSHEVYSGRFELKNIKSIGYVISDNKKIYPMPSKNEINKAILIKNLDFIEAVTKSLKGHNKDHLIQGANKSFHIFITFDNGKTACLFSSVKTKGAYLSPIFNFDSYGHYNNSLYNLFYTHSIK